MAIILDATIGGIASNSYITVTRASELAATLPHMNEWFTDATINKPQLLIHATRMIDLHFIPNGSRANSSQSLWWPQSKLYYENTTVSVPVHIVPTFVEYATIEWAWNLYQNPEPYDDIAFGLTRLRSPSYEMEFGSGRQQLIPRIVSELLGPYCARKLGPFPRLVRV